MRMEKAIRMMFLVRSIIRYHRCGPCQRGSLGWRKVMMGLRRDVKLECCKVDVVDVMMFVETKVCEIA